MRRQNGRAAGRGWRGGATGGRWGWCWRGRAAEDPPEVALPVLSIPPDALWRGTLLMKPGGFLCVSGEAHRAGREGRTRLEIHAQKVEATRHAADEGLIRVLLEPEVGEHLIHHPHRAAQVPAAAREDHPVIHEAGVADAGEPGHGVIQGGEVEGPHQGRERGAEGDALGDGVEIAVLHEGAG